MTVGTDPVLLVDGLDLATGSAAADLLREEAAQVGLPGVFVIAQIAELSPDLKASSLGADALLAGQPNRSLLMDLKTPESRAESQIETAPYDDYRHAAHGDPRQVSDRLEAVLCGWDDTPSGGNLVLTGGNPRSYGDWLGSAIRTARDSLPRDRRMVFVASWNDWAHGAYLEPDIIDGRAYLEATRAALALPASVTGVAK